MAIVERRGGEYSIKKNLVAKWDSIRNGRLAKLDEDRVYVVDGREGCQPAGSKVLLADGTWKNIEEILKGDIILSPQTNGTIVFSKVTDTFKWFSDKNYDVYELNRKNMKLYSCSSNHLIPFNVKVYPRKNGKRLSEDSYWRVKNYEADYVFNEVGKRFKKESTSILCPPIKNFLNKKNSAIEPYCLGVFLGDGSFYSGKNRKGNKSRGLNITSDDFEILEEVSKHYPIMSIGKKKGTTAKTYRFSLNKEFSSELERLGLCGSNSGTKFIPEECLKSDLEYRKRLLAGLIDTDGYLDKSNSYSICTKSKIMAENILDLVHTLGGRGNISKVTKTIKRIGFKGQYYNISFYLGKINLPINVKKKIRKGNFFYKSANRISIDLKKGVSGEVYGFELDSRSKLYVTDNWMVTHNTGKSLFTIQQAAYIDETILDDADGKVLPRICFTPEETLHAIRTSKSTKDKTTVIIFDEAFRGLSSKSALSKTNKHIVQAMMEMRQNNLVLFIVTPSFFLLEMYPAILRSNALFHIGKSKSSKKRFFKAFNYRKKAKIYQIGIRKGWGYPQSTGFMGNFYNKYPGGDEFEARYRKKKFDFLINNETNEEEEGRFKIQRNLMIYNMKNKGMKQKEIVLELKKSGIDIKQPTIAKICQKFDKEKEKGKLMMDLARNDMENGGK